MRVWNKKISERVDILMDKFDDKFPDRSWFISTTLWDDGDYLIEITSSWGNMQDIICYRYSTNETRYQQRKIQTWSLVVDEEL